MENNIYYLLLDDEVTSEIPEIHSVKTIKEAVMTMKKNDVKIVFLDGVLTGHETGLDFLKIMTAYKLKPAEIIIVSGHPKLRTDMLKYMEEHPYFEDIKSSTMDKMMITYADSYTDYSSILSYHTK